MLYKVVNYHYKSFITTGKYRKSYNIGERVIADPKTLGLMCFSDLYRTKQFIKSVGIYGEILIILSVQPMDTPKILQDKICVSSGEWELDYFYGTLNVHKVDPPEGTICCYSLRVLDEIERIKIHKH